MRRDGGGAEQHRWQRQVAPFAGAAIVAVVGLLTFVSVRRSATAREQVTHTEAVIDRAGALLSTMQDAETGQRGFLVTGEAPYLEPFTEAVARIAVDTSSLRTLVLDNPTQMRQLDTLGGLIAAKVAELTETIDLRRADGFPAAAAVVRTNRGKQTMDAIRRAIRAVQTEERRLLSARREAEERWARIVTLVVTFGTIAAVVAGAAVNGMLSRYALTQEQAARLLALQNEQLQAQAVELELQQQQVQDQAVELESQNEQLQEQAVEAEAYNAQLEEAAEYLALRTTEAERANAAKSEFMAAMSHELRTPLNAIVGYVELLSMGIRGSVSDEQERDLQRIRKSSVHLLGLINDILNLARIEAGRVDLDPRDVPVAPMVEDVASLVLPQMRAKGIACVVDSSETAVVVHADPERLRQILLNLLSNAYKFTEPGGVVTVQHRADPSSAMVCIDVADTGRGIPADRLTAIFEPFVQIDRRLTAEGEQGVGLGLAISSDLAKVMGGSLSVCSTLGVGSTFSLVLPAGS